MFLPSNVAHWGNAVLNHKEKNQQGVIYFLKLDLERKKASKETIKRTVSEYELVFCNHFFETSHFVNFISTNRLAVNQRDDFFRYLLLFIKQFYPDYDLCKNINDGRALMILFNNLYAKINEILFHFYDTTDINDIKNNMEIIHKIYKFYGIIEDFMIRFYGYSIVGISNQKHIITACGNCEKKFLNYLMEGYSLFRMQQISLINKDNPEKSYYRFHEVFPTKDIGIPFDEYIEISGEDDRLETKKLVKIS